MFAQTIEAIRSGRTKREQIAALKRDNKQREEQVLEAQLDDIKADVRTDGDRAKLAEREVQRKRDLIAAQAEQAALASELDGIILRFGAKFEELERAAIRVSTLNRAGSAGAMSGLRYATLKALWSNARVFAKRIKLNAGAGSNKITALADVYRPPSPLDQ